MRFDIAPASADAGTKATLTLGRTAVANAGASAAPTSLTWPGDDGMRDAKLSFDAPSGVAPIEAHGPWALFRLLKAASISPGDEPGQFLLLFRSGEHEASFVLHAQSARTPFGSTALQGFQCPAL